MDSRPERAWVAPAVAAHVGELAPHLRETDRREARAAFGRPASVILQAGFRNARRCWTVLSGRRPVAMFGVGRRPNPRVGTAWLLASEDFEGLRGQLRREGPYWADVLMTGHDVLANFVLAENRVAIRWLTWLGFEMLVLHRGAGFGGEDLWEFAAFRPGTRERYLARALRASLAAAAESPAAPGEVDSAPAPRPALRARGHRAETG